jgi:hypothetical protein
VHTLSKQSDWLFQHLGEILAAVGFVGLLAAGSVLTFYAVYYPGPITANPTNWGTFGDFLGGSLNPIFGFLGLLALLLTLWVQSRELALSREELRVTREQLERSAEAQEKSVAALARQARLQQTALAATLTQLKISALQVGIKAIEFESYGVVEHGRTRYSAPIKGVEAKMDALIQQLEEKIEHG